MMGMEVNYLNNNDCFELETVRLKRLMKKHRITIDEVIKAVYDYLDDKNFDEQRKETFNG
jgi:hypothetical protein